MDALLWCLMIFSLSLSYWFDSSKDKLVFLFSFPSVLLLLFALSSLNSGVNHGDYFHYATPVVDEWVLFYVVLTIITYPIGFFVARAFIKLKGGAFFIDVGIYSLKRMIFVFYVLAAVSIVCFFANYSRVGFSHALLFENPRLYESIFGSNWLINYGYFLMVPALCLMVVISWLGGAGWKIYLISFFLLFISFFHGIKYTVFDAIVFPLLFYVILFGFSLKSKLISFFSFFAFIVFFAFFSFLIRGSEDLDFFEFLNYMIPNYYNFFYAINEFGFLLSSPLDALFGFFSLSLDFSRDTLGAGFYLNDKYNMPTGYSVALSSLGPFGMTILIAMFSFLIRFSQRQGGLFYLFFCAYLLFCLLMMFYSYYFMTKYKYIYFLLIFLLIDVFSKNRVTRNNK